MVFTPVHVHKLLKSHVILLHGSIRKDRELGSSHQSIKTEGIQASHVRRKIAMCSGILVSVKEKQTEGEVPKVPSRKTKQERLDERWVIGMAWGCLDKRKRKTGRSRKHRRRQRKKQRRQSKPTQN